MGKIQRNTGQSRWKGYFCVLLFLTVGIVCLSLLKKPKEKREVFTRNDSRISEKDSCNMTWTQANVAKFVVCTLGEVPKSKEGDLYWYSKYYLALKEMKCTTLKEKNAYKSLSYAEFEALIKEILGEEYEVRLQIADNRMNDAVNLETFTKLYIKAIETYKDCGLKVADYVILATPSDDEGLSAWEIKTDKGKMNFEGLIVDPFKGKRVELMVKDQQILAVKRVKGGEILSEQPENRETDILQKVTEDGVVLKRAGRLKKGKLKIENEITGTNYSQLEDLPCGMRVEAIIKGDTLTTLKIVDFPDKETIRVLLSEENGNYIHDKVQLISENDYIMIYNGKTYDLESEKSWDASRFDWQDKDTVCFKPKKAGSMMKVMSMRKSGAYPQYEGALEVTRTDKGYILVNELEMENYIAAVIPSEMPTSYGLESAKVQAVAARTYARLCQRSAKYMKYGAQIDDTTDSQVYNRVGSNQLSRQAAQKTEGQVLESREGELVNGKFFATSCGYTANFGEVWSSDASFSAKTPSYLQATSQLENQEKVGDLTNEKVAYQFLTKQPDEVAAYDSESPWFRWKVNFTASQLSSHLNAGLKEMSSEGYPYIQQKNAQGNWVSSKINSIGEIESFQVEKRGEGGNMMSLIIEGEKGSVRVQTEYVIRCLFGGKGLKVQRADQSVIEDMSLLPSAFFVISEERSGDGGLKKLTLYGGGYGHGVGMSQDGVRGMTKLGKNYEEILKHYYPNTEIVCLNECE